MSVVGRLVNIVGRQAKVAGVALIFATIACRHDPSLSFVVWALTLKDDLEAPTEP